MSDSPYEYIEKLRAENKALRHAVMQVVQEKHVILEALARENARVLDLQRKLDRAKQHYTHEP